MSKVRLLDKNDIPNAVQASAATDVSMRLAVTRDVNDKYNRDYEESNEKMQELSVFNSLALIDQSHSNQAAAQVAVSRGMN